MVSVICLATVIYLEARGEDYQGQMAVAEVVMNRVSSEGYPNTVCGVVRQKGQFAFNNSITYKVEKSPVLQVSKKAIRQDTNITKGATHFHSGGKPYWTSVMLPTVKIGKHRFYKED